MKDQMANGCENHSSTKGVKYRWQYREFPPGGVESLTAELKVPSWVGRYLASVGVNSPEEGRDWLEPRLRLLPPPESLPDLEPAVERLHSAVRAGEPIVVCGDYDVDGLTATYLLSRFLEEYGARVTRRVPDRMTEGYGLHPHVVRELAAAGASLLVTVDCGTADREAVEQAQALGMEVIVTDHHLPSGALPPALAVVNPRRLPEEHPFYHLAGVGVAFYLAAALRARIRKENPSPAEREPNLRRYLDLVALGTLADIMPLQGVNRILVRQGLEELGNGRRPALEALRRVAGVSPGAVRSSDAVFRFAPRVNAASRLGRQDLVFQWLDSGGPEEAEALAGRLERLNRDRTLLERDILAEATARVETEPALRAAPALVLESPDWHSGVLGIVAHRLVERWHKPTVLLTRKNGRWEGSGRSLDGFHLHAALRECAPLLERFGGHALAVGLSLREERLEEFRSRMESIAVRQLRGRTLDRMLEVHAALPFSQIDDSTLEWIDRLRPFGRGCPEPVFMTEGLEVLRWDVVGERHVRMLLGQNGRRLPAIAFRMASSVEKPPRRLDACAFVPALNHWNGQTTLQLRIVDIVPGSGGG
jgi:single-stranded-DNA-specific exonuclease